MSTQDDDLDAARDLWNRVADDWRLQVGDDGDANRRLNSDPVLLGFAGDVRGLDVLDAGCGPATCRASCSIWARASSASPSRRG